MMIDFALAAEREQGLSPYEAIYQACLLRFRPILMTTMAALLGALPLMLSTGVGAELRQPLGVCMVGGLIMSQILTYLPPLLSICCLISYHFTLIAINALNMIMERCHEAVCSIYSTTCCYYTT